MVLLCLAHFCVSLAVPQNLGFIAVALLVENPCLLAVVGCRMLNHMKETGARSLQQDKSQSFCGPRPTLASIEFAYFTSQSGSPTELTESELRARVDSDS